MSPQKTSLSFGKIFLVLGALSVCAPSFADVKIGVVDVRKVGEECTEGKSIRSKLTKKIADRKQSLESQRDAIAKQGDELMKQESVLKPDALQKRRAELQAKASQLQEAAMKAEKEIAEEQENLTKPLQDKILKIIAALAQDGRYSMILHKDAILWSDKNENDLTAEVIRKINGK